MTHRPSFRDPRFENDFWSIDQFGRITYDGHVCNVIELSNMPKQINDALDAHLEDGYHPDCVICQADPRTAMELRSNVISAALKGDDLTSNERAELWSELDEIHTWLQKDSQDNDLTRAGLVRNIENARAAAAREANPDRARQATANAEYFESKLKVYDETGEYQM